MYIYLCKGLWSGSKLLSYSFLVALNLTDAFACFIIAQHWGSLFNWNPYPWKVRSRLSYIGYVILTENLATLKARIWTTTLSIYLFWNLLASAPHDYIMKWKHFPRYWPFVQGIHRSQVNSPHKGQWHGAFMFSLICVWINGWVNNREAGDLRRFRAH